MIGLSIGHTKDRPGVWYPGLEREYYYNALVCKAIAARWAQQCFDEFVLIDESDEGPYIHDTVRQAQQNGVKLVAEIHHNSGSPNDYALIYHYRGNRKTKGVAGHMIGQLYTATTDHGNTRGIVAALPDDRYGHKWLIEDASIHSIIIEPVFMNSVQAKPYFAGGWADVASVIADTLREAYGLYYVYT